MRPVQGEVESDAALGASVAPARGKAFVLGWGTPFSESLLQTLPLSGGWSIPEAPAARPGMQGMLNERTQGFPSPGPLGEYGLSMPLHCLSTADSRLSVRGPGALNTTPALSRDDEVRGAAGAWSLR